MIEPEVIKAVDIPDAWFQCVSRIQEIGNRYIVEKGSFEGQTRLEFQFIVISIANAYRSQYDLMLPEIPEHLGIANPVARGYIEQYVPYLLTNHIEPEEQYTYGSRIYDQITHFSQLLKDTPGTNQAILQVAKPDDSGLSDPPCLRHIDMRVEDKKLHFYPYFRSWDLWGGFPANLAGIAVLQEIMASQIDVAVGGICASSKGLHLYGYAEPLAKLRCGK